MAKELIIGSYIGIYTGIGQEQLTVTYRTRLHATVTSFVRYTS